MPRSPAYPARAIAIPAAALDRLIAEAAAAPDREICGLLLGSGDRVAEVRDVANASPHPADGFELDPSALLSAHRAARGGGPAVLGHYHSHPRGPAIPSARDAEAAESGLLWLILGEGRARLWLAEADGFAECAIVRR